MNRNMMRAVIKMGTPDKLKVAHLHPPPLPKIIPEKYEKKIFIYLTDSLKKKYEILKGEDETWSQIGRKALKAYFEGSHTLQMPNIEEYLIEIMALITHQKLPITQPRNKGDESLWIERKKQAIERMEIQKPSHVGFEDCVNELNERFEGNENKGLESVEIEERKELTKQELKEVAFENRESYKDFLRQKQATKNSFADCKWKVKGKV